MPGAADLAVTGPVTFLFAVAIIDSHAITHSVADLFAVRLSFAN